jgi:hypothetical protein
MKREELLKIFPSLTESEIQDLPNELVVCWYPSSGTGCDSETLYNGYGYNILDHWKQQSSNFKPNLFIFSDAREFNIHEEAEVLFTKTYFEDSVISFLDNPITVDYDLIPNDHYINESEQFIKDLGRLFELGLVDENHWMSEFENPRSPAENEIYKLEIKLLLEAGVFPKDNIVKERKQKEYNNLINGLFGPVKTLSIIRYLETFFILVQTTNKFLYSRFVEEEIKIPLLTLNRPMDPFIFDNGIDIKKLGIQEFIAGHSYVISLVFGDEFKKHPDFVFQLFNKVHNDMANLYSYNIKTV